MTTAIVIAAASLIALLIGRDVVIRYLADRRDARATAVHALEGRVAKLEADHAEASKTIAAVSKKVDGQLARRVRA